ncbi:MAG TPA: cobalamin biosynthesis protein, partial [Acidimicrobiales bacterium]|nr:cobalamin biosynthesis protein [Acidimicrobiales bacterium]
MTLPLPSGWARRALGAAAGLALDRLAGEPPLPARLHPVALFGAGVAALERRIYDDRLGPGAALTAAGVGAAALAGAALRSPGVATYLSASGRGLHEAALAVADALDAGDLAGARGLLTSLVGRDPSHLDEAAIARAVVESVAENTTDAVVAPALWTVTAGPVGTFVHRAGDTLDSMVGYRDDRYRRFGTASARLDDALAWAPARATAALVALARPRRAAAVARAVRRDAGRHPSPNAGVAEAAFAAALDLRLGGTENRYGGHTEVRPALGDGRAPARADVRAAVALSRDVTWLLAGLLAGAALTAVAARAAPARAGGTAAANCTAAAARAAG